MADIGKILDYKEAFNSAGLVGRRFGDSFYQQAYLASSFPGAHPRGQSSLGSPTLDFTSLTSELIFLPLPETCQTWLRAEIASLDKQIDRAKANRAKLVLAEGVVLKELQLSNYSIKSSTEKKTHFEDKLSYLEAKLFKPDLGGPLTRLHPSSWPEGVCTAIDKWIEADDFKK